MSITFSDLGVPEGISQALARRGITEPFDIQAATIADALAGRDVCGRAPTGSGKTLAFGIPLVATVDHGEPLTPSSHGRPGRPARPRALVLAPTRELAEQIATELETVAGEVRLGVVYGGVGYGGQVAALRRGVDLLVACPGRLEDLMAQGLVDLGHVTRVVIDEADRMADMGFLPAVRRLLDRTASPRQTVLFSATLDGDVARLTADYQRDPVRHEVGESSDDRISGDHVFWRADATNRTELTVEAVNALWPAIVFSKTRHGSDRLARQLRQQGIVTAAIHGGRSQSQRNQALADFTAGKVHALVATDVAARGIHVDGVASVIHYDPPEDHKAYIHRSGRTARAGRRGVVLSLVRPAEVKELRRLQREVGIDGPLVDPDPAALRALADPGPGTPPARIAPAQVTETDAEVSFAGEAEEPRAEHRSPARRRSRRPDAPAADTLTDAAGAGERPPRRQQRTGDGPRRSRQGGLNLTSRTRIARPTNRQADPSSPDERDPGRGDTDRGDARRGGARRTSRWSEGGQGEARRSDATRSDASRSGARQGDARRSRTDQGDARQDDGRWSDAARGAVRRGGARQAQAGAERSDGGQGAARGPQPAPGSRRSDTERGPARSGDAPRPKKAGASAAAKAGSRTATSRSGGTGGYGRPSSPGPKQGGNRKTRRAHLQWNANR